MLDKKMIVTVNFDVRKGGIDSETKTSGACVIIIQNGEIVNSLGKTIDTCSNELNEKILRYVKWEYRLDSSTCVVLTSITKL